MSIKVSEIRARLEGYPILQELVDFLSHRMLIMPFDDRYGRMLKELDRISEAR